LFLGNAALSFLLTLGIFFLCPLQPFLALSLFSLLALEKALGSVTLRLKAGGRHSLSNPPLGALLCSSNTVFVSVARHGV
jgi:hypothetical protein